MEEQLITYETAKLAKKKGFDSGSLHFYIGKHLEDRDDFSTFSNKDILGMRIQYEAPTQSLLQKWLREAHNIFIWVLEGENPNFLKIPYNYYIMMRAFRITYSWKHDVKGWGNTYEEVLEKGLQEALKLIK